MSADEPAIKTVIVVGGGFAGTFAALGAARKADERATDEVQLDVQLVDPDPWLTVRPRLYEESFRDARVWLDRVLEPVGIRRLQAKAVDIEPAAQSLEILYETGDRETREYDGLVLAAGSHVVRPPIRGLEDHAFTVDTYDEAVELDRGLREAVSKSDSLNVAVIGAGFTGLEVATEMVGRLKSLQSDSSPTDGKVVLVDRSEEVGAGLGERPRPVIEEALDTLGIETVLGSPVVEMTESHVFLEDGTEVPADVVVWTGGLMANPLAESLADSLGVEVDGKGRLPVDESLRVAEADGIWAAGDVGRAHVDGDRTTLQSCQHALHMGRVAGHNVAASLLGEEEMAYEQQVYVTCLDLGDWGALFTNGWERDPVLTGEQGKAVKRRINRTEIVPPTTGQPEDLYRAADPESTYGN